ncbi:MAG: aminotransferase class I/II-fold pyridoxal phosphate-dependent enzyme [Planctomycetota bacterium]|nr:aminotransferase class I/II-fold pyridoxal phosphate-dependent enzyme [Planctomycetota bacterium]
MSTDHPTTPETLCVHGGHRETKFHPVVVPIYQVSTFAFEDVDHGAALFAGTGKGYIYSRMGNPTVEALEDALAALEGGHKSLACGSGMAAINTTIMALMSAGDHAVVSDAVYGPTCTLFESIMTRFGIESTFVDASDLQAIRDAIQPNTKMVYIETPGNPTLVISDIREAAQIAHDCGAQLVVDNTFMTPILQRPLDLGADVVVHSLTKFLNGHADVVGGAIIVRDEKTYQSFRKVLNQLGGVLPPMESFLVHRGLKTLALRVQRQSESGLKIAEYLESHPAVEWVRYPFLPSHPQHDIARKQSSGGSALVSFELKAGLEAGRTVMNSVKLCGLAVSLGGVETLIQHPASMTHASMGADARRRANITDGLVRISVGIEDVDDLIADLDQALAKIEANEPAMAAH